jgi:hypothetical protein
MPMRRKRQICIIPQIWKMSNKGRGGKRVSVPYLKFWHICFGEFRFLTVFLASRYPCVCLCDIFFFN